MVKITVLFGDFLNTTYQEKTFKDEEACIEWCRRNHQKIGCINDYRTGFRPVSHFEIIGAIRGATN